VWRLGPVLSPTPTFKNQVLRAASVNGHCGSSSRIQGKQSVDGGGGCGAGRAFDRQGRKWRCLHAFSPRYLISSAPRALSGDSVRQATPGVPRVLERAPASFPLTARGPPPSPQGQPLQPPLTLISRRSHTYSLYSLGMNKLDQSAEILTCPLKSDVY
jgi:hypothetical protein